MKIAAAYIRVSDERQDEYSPDSQLKLIQKYALDHDMYIPQELIFYDDGISAKSAKKRTEFNRMIALAKEKSPAFQSILVWKFSRFARNQEESIVYKNLLRKKGISVISVSEPIEDSPYGNLIERIIEWMDEFYLINLSTEVKRGMLEKASRGEAMCAPAIGYDLINKKYVPNAQAEFVRRIFQDYLEGIPMRQLAIKYSAAGLTTKRGNKLESRTIQYMLYNPVYIGKIRWSTNGGFSKKRNFDDPEILTVDGEHEPIIDLDTWNAVQEKLKNEKQMYGRYQRAAQPHEWMLKGLLRCGNCGGTLVKSQEKYVQCHQYSKGRNCKISHCISIAKADKVIIEALKDCVENQTFNIVPKEKPKDTTDYSVLIEKEKARLNRAKEAYLNGADTIEEYKQNKTMIEKAIALIERQAAEKHTEEAVDISAFSDKVSSVLEVVTDSTATTEAKNAALRSILSKISLHKPNNSFTLFFYI